MVVLAGMVRGPGQPVRRTFTAAYKLRIVEEYYLVDRTWRSGCVAASRGPVSVASWRNGAERGTGELAIRTGTVVRAGRASGAHSAAERRLLAENARLESELAKAKAVLEVVGKAHALLEILSESAEKQPPHR